MKTIPVHCTALCLLAFLLPENAVVASSAGNAMKIEIQQHPDGDVAAQTARIQEAIDNAAKAGGGSVVFPAGRYVTGALHLRDHVHIELREGAVLAGSGAWADYGSGSWGDAMFRGDKVRGVRISGPAVIDGSGVTREGGEEGFRGPHTFFFENASDIRMENLTIQHSGNYAVLCRTVENAVFHRVTILGGHDGVHIQNGSHVTITDCDFRTGDDCVAGTDNTHVTVVGSRFNSSCNAFRLGVKHFVVRDCVFQGPGEHPHKVSVRKGAPRHNMLAAFVHFSPRDRKPKIPSDDWLVENCTMDGVRSVYAYNHERGLWQTGQPAKRLRFVNVTATRVEQPVRVLGDTERLFDLDLENVSISLHPDHAGQEVLDIRRFGRVRLHHVTLTNNGNVPPIRINEGTLLEWDGTTARLAAEIGDITNVRVTP